MDPAARLEVIFRLQAATVAWERGDLPAVCSEGTAYLDEPDPHLDLVTRRPEVHAMVGLAWARLGEPELAVHHLEQALLGERHLTVVAPDDVHRVVAECRLLIAGPAQALDQGSRSSGSPGASSSSAPSGTE